MSCSSLYIAYAYRTECRLCSLLHPESRVSSSRPLLPLSHERARLRIERYDPPGKHGPQNDLPSCTVLCTSYTPWTRHTRTRMEHPGMMTVLETWRARKSHARPVNLLLFLRFFLFSFLHFLPAPGQLVARYSVVVEGHSFVCPATGALVLCIRHALLCQSRCP